jgi:fructose-bisphosphate aldolase, class II
MTTASTRDLMRDAVERSGVVPAFNVITLEHAEAVVDGLARAESSGILQVSERALQFHADRIEPILSACAHLAASADVPIAIHLDHVQDRALAWRAIESASQFGVSSIMFDFSALDRPDNVRLTSEATTHAHAQELFVEAELGRIGGKDGAHAPGARTDPDDAFDFVAETGVDALAVAIGSSHAMTIRDARLDLDLAARLAQRVQVPLVLHGSSGVPDHELVAAVGAGVRKVNVGTALNVSFTAAVRRVLAEKPALTDPRDYLREARAAVSTTVEEFCRVLAGHEIRLHSTEGAPS